jgi:ribA/ribD-fused uncharacterized protein
MNATPRQTRPASNQQSAVPSDSDPNEPIFFFKPNEEHGEFCQWYRATFTVSKAEMSTLIGHPIDEDDPAGWQLLFFNCAEQFMMYCKAGRFHDSETQKRILATNDPKEQKRLARLTKGFEAASWDKIKSEVVVAGNMAKFEQNRALRSLLLATGDRVLAEAASLDRVWGIGFTAEEARALNNQEGWGENRLGKALMEVRGRLRQEETMRVVGDDEVIWTS